VPPKAGQQPLKPTQLLSVHPILGCRVRDCSPWGVGSEACPCQVPPFTVVEAQTPSQLIQSLPFPFCFWFSWVLRDGSASSWRAGSQPLSPSFCLSPTHSSSPPAPCPGAGLGRWWSYPSRCPGRWRELGAPTSSLGAVRWSEKGAACLVLGVPANGLFDLIGEPMCGLERAIDLSSLEARWPLVLPPPPPALVSVFSRASCTRAVPRGSKRSRARGLGLPALLPAGLYRGYIERRSALEPAS